MAKTKISEYDSTAANNTDIDSINIAEGMAPSNVNNAIRELMAHLKDGLGAGTPVFLDQTNNAVGIGTTSLSSYSVQDLVISNTGNNVGITIQSDTSGMGKIHFADGTSGSELYRGAVRYQHSSDTMDFWTGATPRNILDSSSQVGINETAPSSKINATNSSVGEDLST